LIAIRLVVTASAGSRHSDAVGVQLREWRFESIKHLVPVMPRRHGLQFAYQIGSNKLLCSASWRQTGTCRRSGPKGKDVPSRISLLQNASVLTQNAAVGDSGGELVNAAKDKVGLGDLDGIVRAVQPSRKALAGPRG
jgi:hypothetical protein